MRKDRNYAIFKIQIPVINWLINTVESIPGMLQNYQQISFENFATVVVKPPTRPEPFLKWAGGKGQLLSQLETLFPASYNRFFEPFLGSGAVFFRLLPDKTILNDINPNLIFAYRHVQTQLELLLELLYSLREKYHAFSLAEQEQEYYRIRDQYNQLKSGSLEKTALLIFLNKTGYNGLYRENARGGYNVPFGRYDNPAMFTEENLRAVSEVLQKVELLNAPFIEGVAAAGPGDFVYFDPPYMPISKTASFTSYTKNTFGPQEQIALSKLVRELSGRQVKVMVSNSNAPFIRELYGEFKLHEVKAGRAINSKPGLRGKITELVITNY